MKIINNIKKLSKEDYESVIDNFIKEFSRFDASLYLFGNIKHPSISDLDLVIVYRDDFLDEEISFLVETANKFISSTDNAKYIFTHPILIYPEKIFKNIKYLHSMQNIKKLYGKEININTPNDIELQILSNVHFINFTYHVLFWLKNLLNSEEVYLRELLLGLNSAKHSLVFLKNFFQNNEDLDKSIFLLEQVRNDFKLIEEIDISMLILQILQLFNEISANFMENVVKTNNIELTSIRYLFNIGNKKLSPIPFSVILHGAMYYKVYPEDKYFYTTIHKLLYPFFDFDILSKEYEKIIKIQIEVAVEFESLYEKFGITPLIPLMCNYCIPNLTFKRKFLLNLNKILIKLPFT